MKSKKTPQNTSLNDDGHTIRVSHAAYKALLTRQNVGFRRDGRRPSLVELVDQALGVVAKKPQNAMADR